MEGRIFNIQHFSVNDGPGIRTTAFLQGCPLHCAWCHNPEGIDSRMQFLWYEERCTRCGACVKACPTGCLAFDDKAILRRDISRCVECGDCALACHYSALECRGMLMSPQSLADALLKDLVFYDVSDGGVTFSGGEPLLQSAFVAKTAELLKQKKEDLNIAVDTSGAVAWWAFEKVLPFVDLFLYDVKQVDAALLKTGTGGELAAVLDNLARLSEIKKTIDLRVPLIKGYNMDERFASHLLTLVIGTRPRRLHLIPYHAHGEKKYERLGLDRSFEHFATPDRAELDWFASFLSDHIEVVIGG